MDKKQLFLIGVSILVIVGLCVGTFVIAAKFYDAQQAEVLPKQQAEKNKDALFDPVIYSSGYDCSVSPELLGKSGTFAYFTIESPDPAKTAVAIETLMNTYQGSTFSSSKYSYKEAVATYNSESLYIDVLIPVVHTDAFAKGLEQISTGKTYLVSKNITSSTSQQIQSGCAYDLASIQSLELKEAAYLTKLKTGTLEQYNIDELVQGLLSARTEYNNILFSNRLDIKNQLDFTRFNINISLSKG